MASAPSMSVSVECVNVCNFPKGDGSGSYDCSFMSCAWKAPRFLTGSLASTAHPHCSSSSGRRNRIKCRCDGSDLGGWYSTEGSEVISLCSPSRKNLPPATCKRWQLCCSSFFSSNGFYEVSPERLWETVCVWQGSQDGEYNCRHILNDHTAEVQAVTVHASNNYFVTASLDNTWCFYDISTGLCLTQIADPSETEGGYTCTSLHLDEGHVGAVTAISFSENGYFLRYWNLTIVEVTSPLVDLI